MRTKIMKEDRIYLIVSLLFVLTIMCSGFVKAEESIPASTYSPEQYYYPSLNNPSNFMTWQDDFCKDSAQMDFIVELTPDACQPNPVTSDLLEEQDVPVLCRLTGVKINPFIQVPYIKRVETIVESQSKEISYINFYPARSALGYYQFDDSEVKNLAGVPTLNNLGYLTVYLKQQPLEKNMSKNVSAKIAVNITYDIAKTYGINTNQFVLPLMNQQQWMESYKKYGFWNGKGYLRVIDIKDKKAKVSVYTNPSGYPLTTREITLGGDPLKIKLPGFYCQGEATIRLDDISIPKPRARIIMNGDELLVEEGREIGESGCNLSKISQDAYSYGGEAVVKCDNVAGSSSQEELRLRIANSLASLKITSGGNSITEDKSLGDEVEVKNGEKVEHYYVGYVGGTSGTGSLTTNEEIKSIIILFAKTGKVQLNENENEKTKFVRAFQDYLKNNRNVMGNNDEIKTEINKDARIKGMIEDVIMIRGDGPASEVTIKDTKIEIYSTSGLKQLYYSKEIENKYDEAIKQYRQIARQFKNQESPEGSFYGIQAYKNAAELASFMFKEKDEVLILQDLIEQYKDSADQEVMAEVDDAREMILALTYGSGDRSIAVQTDQGSYFMTLLFIERASFDSQEAKLKVDNSVVESYYLGSQIGNWIVQGIEDNDVIFSSGEATKKIKKGSIDVLAPNNKVEVVDINIQKEATVTVLPFSKEQYTTTNFSVVIGIEKRAIQLTPEQTKNRIKELNKTIDAMNKYIKILNTTTQAWKTACYAGGTALWAKNFITGLSGESLARKIVMKAWTIKCASEDFRKQDDRIIGISECYRKNEGTINQDIASVKDIVSRANSFIKKVKETPGVILKGGIFGLSKQIDDEAFVKAAEDLFQSDTSGLNVEHINIQIELGKISRQQRQDLSAKIKYVPTMDDGSKICTDEKGESYNLTRLMGLTDSQIISDKNLKVCSINFPVIVKTVLGNLTKLSQEGIIYTDNVKEIYYMLALNQKASSNEISQVLKDYNNVQIFSKFPYYESIIKKKVNEDNLIQKTGLDVQHYSTDSVKALTVSSIPLLSQEVVSTKFSGDDQGNLTAYIGKNKYLIIATDYEEFFAILEETTVGKFTYKKVFNITIDEAGGIKLLQELTLSQIAERKLPPILEQDISKCKHTMNKEDQNIKFWETGPYEGFVAYMPINKGDGWYFTTKGYSGTEGDLVSWKETGQLNEYWICNVGENGKPDFNFYKGPEGDDNCCYQISKTTGMEIAKEVQDIANKVETDCVPKAVDSYQKKENPVKAGSCGTYSLGKPPVLIPSTQCEDFMSPTDCLILFNLCDPVICPSSRCDFSGRFPVDNVIQSGIVGSLLLCSGNSKEVIMPICITGLYNGLDALNNMVFKQYAQCLQTQLDTGQTTGVCDYFHSVYLCQMLWGNLDPFIKGGLPEIVSSVTQGGGEYAQFSEAIKSSEESYQYFTNYYGANAFAAFKERSVNQGGTNICSRYVSIVTPTSAKFFEDLTKADSYYQVFASVDEIPMGGGSPESQYRVFYNIYAGQEQAVSYYVYLKKKSTQSYAYELQQLSVRDAVGFLGAGQTVAEKKDFTAPSGYNEVCINVNGKDHCGFGTMSTSFAVQELQNVYLQDQIKKNIKTEQECKAGSASIVPTANFNLQSQIQEKLQPEIYRRGIVRQCASENPGASTDPSRYQRIGYCGDQKVACWLDMQSVDASISDLGIVEDITTYAENQNMKQMIDQLGLDTVEQSQSKLDEAQAKIETVEQDANQFIDRVREKFAQWKKSQETQTSGTTTTGNAILPLTGQAISSVNDIQIEFPDANIPSNEYDSLRQKIRGTITNLLSNVILSENLQYFPSKIDIYLGNPTSNVAGLGCDKNGLMILSVKKNSGTGVVDGPDASTTLHEILHCIMLNKGYDLYYTTDFSNSLKTFLASTSLNKYQANTRDTLIKRLTDLGVDYLYTKNYEGGLPLIAQESFTSIGEYLYGEYVNPSNKYEFPEDILTAYNGILRPGVISVGKNGQGPDVSPITGTSTTGTTVTGKWDTVTSPELLEIQKWANQETVKLGEEITKQIISLKAISEKCARPDEKARAEAYIAKLLDLRARMYSVVDIERELKWIEDQSKLKSCGDVGGTWKQNCGSDESNIIEQVTDIADKESNTGKKCCSSITLGGTCWPVNGYQKVITAPACSQRSASGECTECNIGARCFGSLRTEDGRLHAGIDLLTTNEETIGKKVVAIEGGKITNIYSFYEGTCAVLVYNSERKRTINYGEVGVIENGVCSDLGEKIIKGNTILPGDKIGIIHRQTGGSAMLHLELYEREVTTNKQWPIGQDQPEGLVNPEEFVSQLQTNGQECSGPQIVASTTPTNKNLICIDPGHNDKTNKGTVSTCQNVIESVHVLAVAEKLKTVLKSKSYEVYLTREGETRNIGTGYLSDGCDGGWRAEDVNNRGCAITISLHSDGTSNAGGGDSDGASTFICDGSQQNRIDQTGCKGSPLETYLYDPGATFPRTYTIWNPTGDSEALAEKLNVEIKSVYNSNGISFGNTVKPDTQAGLVSSGQASAIGILCRAKMPSVLLEIGGHNNPSQCQKLEDATYQQSLADAIATGVDNYMKGTEVTTPPVSGAITGEAILVSKVNDGAFTRTNNIINWGDKIRICAAININGKYYSSDEVSFSGIAALNGFSSVKVSWYKIDPLWKHSDSISTSSLPIVYGGPFGYYQNNVQSVLWQRPNADTIQYSQELISNENGGCIDGVDSAGTYYYRAELTYENKIYSSPGYSASSTDVGSGKTYPQSFSGLSNTLLAPSAYDRGIDSSILRFVRLSNYNNDQATDNEVNFIRHVEMYKNVPYVLNTVYGTLMEAYTGNFVAIECLSLLTGAAKSTGHSVQIAASGEELVQQFGTLSLNGRKIEMISLSEVLGLGIPINKSNPNAMHIGDIILLHDGTHYYTAYALYKDQAPLGTFDSNDQVIYVSYTCHASNNGQLCYNNIGYALSYGSKAAIVRII